MKNEKIIYDENTDTKSQHFHSSQIKDSDFDKIKTPFWKSFLFLIIEFLVPTFSLWLLTGNDFGFSYSINTIYIVFSTIGVFIFDILLTYIIYKLRLHKSDQFTYVISLTAAMLAFYITGFWWHIHIFYRLLSVLFILIIFTLIGTLISAYFYNKSLKTENI